MYRARLSDRGLVPLKCALKKSSHSEPPPVTPNLHTARYEKKRAQHINRNSSSRRWLTQLHQIGHDMHKEIALHRGTEEVCHRLHTRGELPSNADGLSTTFRQIRPSSLLSGGSDEFHRLSSAFSTVDMSSPDSIPVPPNDVRRSSRVIASRKGTFLL